MKIFIKYAKGLVVITIGILIPLAFTFLSLYVLFFIGDLHTNGTFLNWHSIGSPPEKVIKIVGICEDEACVETQNKKFYMFNSYHCNEAAIQSCWEQVDSILVEEPQMIDCWYKFPTKNPPRNTVQSIVTNDCGSGGASQANYALLKDGSIWAWEKSTTDLQGVIWVLWAIPVTIISLIVGSIIALKFTPAIWRKWTTAS